MIVITYAKGNKSLLFDYFPIFIKEPLWFESLWILPIIRISHDVVQHGEYDGVTGYPVASDIDIRVSPVRHSLGGNGAQPLYLHDGGLGVAQLASVIQCGRSVSQHIIYLLLNFALTKYTDLHFGQ